MKTSPRGIALIKRFEDCRLVSYRDSAGIWTIGWGRTKGVTATSGCTQEQADEWLIEDLGEAEEEVAKRIVVPITESMHDALVSWTYNLGGHNFANSTMRQRLNDRMYLDAAHEMTRWWRTPGSELGLQRRRAAEWALFLEDGLP